MSDYECRICKNKGTKWCDTCYGYFCDYHDVHAHAKKVNRNSYANVNINANVNTENGNMHFTMHDEKDDNNISSVNNH